MELQWTGSVINSTGQTQGSNTLRPMIRRVGNVRSSSKQAMRRFPGGLWLILAIGGCAVFKEGRVCHEDRQCRQKTYHIVPGGQISQHTVGKHSVKLDKLGDNYTHD